MPFALSRFCGAEGLKDVIPVSELRKREFGESYGVRISDGPLAGVFSRAVVIIDENGKVLNAAFHAGLPVTTGRKYAINMWVRANPCR